MERVEEREKAGEEVAGRCVGIEKIFLEFSLWLFSFFETYRHG